MSPVNVIREDPKNENILYLGNDLGVFVSFDQGENWQAFVKGLTTAAVHDLVVQPEKNHLLVGTHGRSIYKADISVLQVAKNELFLAEIEDIRHSKGWGSSYSQWREPNEPRTVFKLYTPQAGTLKWQIIDEQKTVVYAAQQPLDKGYNFIEYKLTIGENQQSNYQRKNKKNPLKSAKNGHYYLPKGTYTLSIEQGTQKRSKEFTIK